MGQATSINQMIDNSEQINKPQRLVDISAIKNLATLKYKKNGVIPIKAGIDGNKAYRILETPQIKGPIQVYEILEGINEKNSGVNAGSKGVEDTDGKATIYEGNERNTADRYGLLNKTYSFAYEKFAELHDNGMRDHLTTKMAVDLIGPEGMETVKLSKNDIFKGDEKLGFMIESSTAEETMSILEKRAKLNYLTTMTQTGMINKDKAVELSGKIAGFDDETMRQLIDLNSFGSQEVMSEADRDIERLLDGDDIKPNLIANVSYKQRFVDYMQDHTEDLDDKQFRLLSQYIIKLDVIIKSNTMRQLAEQQLLEASQAPQQEEKSLGAPKQILPVTNEEQVTNTFN